MSINGLTFLFLAIIAAAIAIVMRYLKVQPPSDEMLREWLSFITKANGRPSSARLHDAEYDAIKQLFHPGLRAEFEERLTRLENECSARAIETALVIRRQAKGLPMSDADDRILIREGLRSDGREKKRTIDPIGENGNEMAQDSGNENEALPGSLADFRHDAGLRSVDGG